MKWIAPSGYGEFVCIADRCKHSCCVGWEIDIDPESLKRYRSAQGEWRKRFEDCIQEAEDGTASFILTHDERCPFLKPDGLCELILSFGEDSLCQICADHPRFRHFYADQTEIGLGLCCEEAARRLLASKESMQLEVIEDDGNDDAVDPEEQIFLAWRNQCIQEIQDRSLPILLRVKKLFPLEVRLSEWKEFLLSLERLEESWADRLRASQEKTLTGDWDLPLEQLMVYLLYRHLPQGFEEGDVEGRLAFASFSWQIVYQLFASSKGGMDELIDIVRQFSSEWEYSEENTEAIIREIDRRKEEEHEFS